MESQKWKALEYCHLLIDKRNPEELCMMKFLENVTESWQPRKKDTMNTSNLGVWKTTKFNPKREVKKRPTIMVGDTKLTSNEPWLYL